MANIFSIPGNIKQMFLPFVLNPNDWLNKVPKDESKSKSKSKSKATPNLGKAFKLKSAEVIATPIDLPLIFSFRNTTLTHENIGSTGKLSICPQSYIDKMSFDISHLLLYSLENNKFNYLFGDYKSRESITVNDIFNSIPGIQIREYLPDAKLLLSIDFFSKVIEILINSMKSVGKEAINSVKELFSSDNSSNASQSLVSNNGFTDKITRVCTFIKNYLTGMSDDNFYSDFFNDDNIKINVPLENISTSIKDNNLINYIYKFPYIMWYKLLSCTTTNIYELPCLVDGKVLYSSDGSQGWNGTTLGFGKMFGDGMIGKLLGMTKVGGMVSSLLGNLNVSVTPWWDARNGANTPCPDVVVKFDLFNDTADNALFNFIFVNTIVPNNKWVQYNLYLHSPHLYDIKIEGGHRLYACSAKFKVTYDGVLRDMSDNWLFVYLRPRLNACMSSYDFHNNAALRKLIKIPDVYHIEMTFSSLIPDTFNNFLFMYSSNANITTEYGNGAERYKSEVINLLNNGLNTLANKTSKVWNGK